MSCAVLKFPRRAALFAGVLIALATSSRVDGQAADPRGDFLDAITISDICARAEEFGMKRPSSQRYVYVI